MCAELQHTKARMKLKFLLSLFTFQRSSPFVRFYPKLHLRLSRRFLNARVVIPPVQRISLPCAIAHGLCRRPSALHQRLVGVRENRRWWLFQRFVSLRVIRTRKARIFFASLPWRAVLVRTAHRGNILRAHSPPGSAGRSPPTAPRPPHPGRRSRPRHGRCGTCGLPARR